MQVAVESGDFGIREVRQAFLRRLAHHAKVPSAERDARPHPLTADRR